MLISCLLDATHSYFSLSLSLSPLSLAPSLPLFIFFKKENLRNSLHQILLHQKLLGLHRALRRSLCKNIRTSIKRIDSRLTGVIGDIFQLQQIRILDNEGSNLRRHIGVGDGRGHVHHDVVGVVCGSAGNAHGVAERGRVVVVGAAHGDGEGPAAGGAAAVGEVCYVEVAGREV